MNQNYLREKYLFVLFGFLVCSLGMAQTPNQKTNKGNPQTSLATSVGNQKNEQVVKKNNDPVSIQSDEASALFNPKEENTSGQPLSKEESESVNKQIKESQKLFGQKLTTVEKTNPQDSVGTKVRTFAKSSNLTAKNIFEVKKGDFDLSSSDKMQLKSVSDHNGRTLATYQQLHNSIPVEGAIFKVRENKTKIDAFGSTSKKLPATTTYKINAETALQNALNTVNAKQYIWESKKLGSLVSKQTSTKPKGELVYVGPNFSTELKEYHLAWKFNIFATNPQSSQTIYVDADSGNVILKINLKRDACAPGQSIGTGKSRFSGDVTFNTKQYADGFRLEALQGKYNVPVYTLNMNHEEHASDEVITEYIDEDNNWNDLYNKNHDEVAIDIHWGVQKTIDYYEEKFDRNSVDNNGMQIIALAHLGNNVENASWTGGWAQFGDGNNAPFVGLGITAHELTHAVTQFSAGLIYLGESGAMNESFSDMFGMSVQYYVGKSSKEKIALLGNELYEHGSLRSMADPKAQGQPDTYGGEFWINPLNYNYDNGGVHTNSGITNYWFYLLSEGGSGVNDLNNSYDIKAIGIAKAEKIAYITLTEYLSPSSNFSDMRQASLMVTEDLYGLGSEEYKQVTNAWYAIGVGASYSEKQISLVAVENPSVACGPLTGTEPFYVTIKNTGSNVIKANEVLNYKLRLLTPRFGTSYNTLYTNDATISFTKDLAIGEERTITIQDKIPFLVSPTIVNYVEIKLDIKPIEDFGAKDGVSFISNFIVPPAQKSYDLKLVGLNLPEYTGETLSDKFPLAVTIYNLGCQDITAGSKLKVGYLNTAAGNETVWKEVTLDADFKMNSAMTIPFDGTIDLSALGLHTYEAFVTYDLDPVASNNSTINSVYNGVVTQFPYAQDFERTPGGWFSESLQTDQKFVWQPLAYGFRDIKSKYLWGTIDFANGGKMLPNADFTLESPIFDFTNVASPYIEFDMIYSYTKGSDGMIIEYSEDKGQNWKKAANVNYPDNTHYNELASGPWFTGVNTSTKKDPYQIRLNELAGKKVSIRFRALRDDAASNFIGSLIDNIKVSDAPYDLEIVSAKVDAGSCAIDNSKATIKAKITNNFLTEGEHVNVSVSILNSAKTEVYSKTEKADLVFTKFKDTITYSIPNINLKDIGQNTIVISVLPDDVTQDLKPKNNTLTFAYDNWKNEDLKITVLPYKIDFEDADKYKGWRTSENNNSAGWLHGINKELGSPGWPMLNDHTHYMASNDDKCNCDAANDMLVSPILDLTKYKEAHLKFEGFGDGLHLSDGYVKVSTDGGETWNTEFKMPYINNWIEYQVDLSAYAGKSCVQVAFVHTDNGLFASGFAVDNIEITDKANYLELSNLSIAQEVYEDAPSHEFYVSAKNLYYSDAQKVTIEYQISQNGTAVGEPVTLERVGHVYQYQTIAYKIDGLPKLPAGKYDIKIKLRRDGQPVELADSISGSFQVIEKANNFEGETFSDVPAESLFGTEGFVSNKSDSNFAWKVVVNPDNTNLTLPKVDHTKDTSARMLYNQLENYDMNGELITPLYKLSDKATALEFYYAIENNYINSFAVDIKTVAGEWTEVFKTSQTGNHADTEWQKGAANLSKYAGKSVMFRMRHSKVAGYSYMVLDDLKIITDAVYDVDVKILSPKDVCGGSEFKVKLTNLGQLPIEKNSIQLNLDYNYKVETITETVALEIPVGQSIDYIFKKQPTLIQGDSHVFTVSAALENDFILSNNEIKNYLYQGVSGDFKIFDKQIIHGYTGQSIYVDAQTNFNAKKLKVASYKWNTGETTSGIDINKAGNYTVTAVMENGCTLTETIAVAFDTFESDLVSGDTCGPEVVLTPGNYKSYEWFDGSTEPTYTTTESGEYFVTVYNENGIGKTFSTTISILENNVVPEIQVVGDKKLTASVDAVSYQWYLNGKAIPNATQKSIVTIWEGEYSLQTTNNNGCNRTSEVFDSKGMLIGKITNPLRVFPNPAVDNVNIFLGEKAEGKVQIKVYGMDGNTISDKTYAAMPSSISVSGLTSGVYILDCITTSRKYSAKIIKK